MRCSPNDIPGRGALDRGGAAMPMSFGAGRRRWGGGGRGSWFSIAFFSLPVAAAATHDTEKTDQARDDDGDAWRGDAGRSEASAQT